MKNQGQEKAVNKKKLSLEATEEDVVLDRLWNESASFLYNFWGHDICFKEDRFPFINIQYIKGSSRYILDERAECVQL